VQAEKSDDEFVIIMNIVLCGCSTNSCVIVHDVGDLDMEMHGEKRNLHTFGKCVRYERGC
jgi:hypothetical protein